MILGLVLGLAFVQPVFAGDEPEAAADASEQVDESEENYRRRMELREQRFNEKPRVDTTYAPQISEGKLDALPPESREHVKQQMRDMIIESRQWKPGDDFSAYPYEPSEAAKTDSALLQLEREAWAEQLQRYQEREAAAYANATGSEAGQGEQGSQAGEGRQAAQGQSGNTASDSAGRPGDSAQQQQSASAAQSQAWTQQERPVPELSAAGVSESALSFVQGQQRQSETAAQAGADTGSPEQAAEGEAASAATELAVSESEAEAEEKTTVVETLAGTLPIEDLGQIANALPSATSANDGAGTASPDETTNAGQTVEPGTIQIAELEKLREN